VWKAKGQRKQRQPAKCSTCFLVSDHQQHNNCKLQKEIIMPVADYAATTNVESTLGDAFTAELTDLRVAETLQVVPGLPAHVSPALPISAIPTTSRQPSTIIPIGGKAPDIFFLGLDIGFVGTSLGAGGYPTCADVTVRFFLEGYGTDESLAAGMPPRYEINIVPQTFAGLNTDPTAGPVRHQLWVPVPKVLVEPTNTIIEAPVTFPGTPVPITWNALFVPNTIYRVAAHVTVNIPDTCWKPLPTDLTGYIEGLVMSTRPGAVFP
jgi:hypothetical protein